MVLASVANLGYAQLQSLWMLYAIMGLSGFAIVGITVLPAQAALINWFNKYRGRALALAFLGPGVGGFLMPPFNEFLIRWWTWRFSYVPIGIVESSSLRSWAAGWPAESTSSPSPAYLHCIGSSEPHSTKKGLDQAVPPSSCTTRT